MSANVLACKQAVDFEAVEELSIFDFCALSALPFNSRTLVFFTFTLGNYSGLIFNSSD